MLNSSWEPLFLEPSKIRKRWCLLSLNRFCHFALQSNLDPRIYIICEYQFQVSNSKYYRAKKSCWNITCLYGAETCQWFSEMSEATQTIHQILINRSHQSYFFYCSLHQPVFITQTFHFMQEQMYLWLFALKYPNITVKQQFTVGWLCLIFSRQLVNNEKLIIFLFHYIQGSKQLNLVV